MWDVGTFSCKYVYPYLWYLQVCPQDRIQLDQLTVHPWLVDTTGENCQVEKSQPQPYRTSVPDTVPLHQQKPCQIES